jgi:Amt family ammonium transporter
MAESDLSMSSTVFVFFAMALVQLMTPGLALFYGGLVRESSVITILMQNVVTMGIVTVLWVVCLYSMCFADSKGFFANPYTYSFLHGVSMHEEGPTAPGIPHLLFVGFQGMFAVITPALMTGCFADRFLFGPYLIFVTLWMILVYAPWCHWVWGGGFLAQWGVVDFAGGIVIHITAGFSALASLLMVGRRAIPEGLDKHQMDVPHNIPLVLTGTALLWFGWFGFNGGSALKAGGLAVAAGVNTEIAGSTATFVWMIIDWRCNKKPSLVGKCVGAIAGLATITPAAGFVQPWAAFAIGIIASVACYLCCEIRRKFNIDDALDVWGVHGMGGFIGSILVGALADPASCLDADPKTNTYCVNPGSIARSWSQLGKQTVAAVFCAVYSFVVTVAILKILKTLMRIVPSKEEQADLDFRLHGEQARSPLKTYEVQRRESNSVPPGAVKDKEPKQQPQRGSFSTTDSDGDSTSDSDSDLA